MTIKDAKYIIIGTEDGWLKYNKSDYEEATQLLTDIRGNSQ